MIVFITNNRRALRAKLHIQWHTVLEMCHIILANLIQLINKLVLLGHIFCLSSSFQSDNLLVFFFSNLSLFSFCSIILLFSFCSIILLVYFSKVEYHTPSEFLSTLDLFVCLFLKILYSLFVAFYSFKRIVIYPHFHNKDFLCFYEFFSHVRVDLYIHSFKMRNYNNFTLKFNYF